MFHAKCKGIFHLFIHGYYTVIYFICQRIPIFFERVRQKNLPPFILKKKTKNHLPAV